MQHIGINPNVIYQARSYENGSAGFQLSQVGADDKGNAYVFKRFQGDVPAHGLVEVDGDDARAMLGSTYTPGRRFGFIGPQRIFDATPENPSYAWLQIYGATRAFNQGTYTLANGDRVYMSTGGFIRNASGGGSANIIGLEIREASAPGATAEVQLNYPVVR